MSKSLKTNGANDTNMMLDSMAGAPPETRKALAHRIDGEITIHYSPTEVGE